MLSNERLDEIREYLAIEDSEWFGSQARYCRLLLEDLLKAYGELKQVLQGEYERSELALDMLSDESERVKVVEEERDRLRSPEWNEKALELFLEWREIETPCKRCHGTGRRVYGDTSTWRGGLGGQMMTGDVCDHCWGSGDEKKLWGSWRQVRSMTSELARLREENGQLKMKLAVQRGPYMDCKLTPQKAGPSHD